MSTRKFYIFVFLASIFAIFMRRPDVLLHPNFWAEDGTIFYQQLYNDGLASFFYTYAGYLHFTPRLVMLLTLPFGIINAPLISNLLSLVLFSMPVLLLFSNRFCFIRPEYKFLIWIYYLFIPNAGETLGNITNIQWYLAVWLLMVMLAETSSASLWKFHDLLVLFLSGLSGPFVIFMLPCLFMRKKTHDILFRIVFVLIAVLQIRCVLLTSLEVRQFSMSAFSIKSVCNLFSWSVRFIDLGLIIGTFLPYEGPYVEFVDSLIFHSRLFRFAIFFIFMLIMIYAFVKGSSRLKLCIIFAGFVLMSAIYRIYIRSYDPQFFVRGLGERYFVIPSLILFTVMIYLAECLSRYRHELRAKIMMGMKIIIALIIFFSLCFSKYPALERLNYRQDIKNIYYPAQKGDSVEIPINPSGWSMKLLKNRNK